MNKQTTECGLWESLRCLYMDEPKEDWWKLVPDHLSSKWWSRKRKKMGKNKGGGE